MDSATETAVRHFQRARGLMVTGQCDQYTWHALVEASWQLGDRNLQLTSPHMRGDDVATMQASLGRLGFDCGRIDGIFGPLAVHAVTSFQSQAGLVADGVCGPLTVRLLRQLAERTGDGPGVPMLREIEQLRAGHQRLAGAKVAVGQLGALGSLIRVIAHGLLAVGTQVVALDQPDPLAQADAANRFEATAYVVFEPSDHPGVMLHYYRVPAFESARGRALAGELRTTLATAMHTDVTVTGMRLPVLRETRMPAVHVLVGPTNDLLERLAEVGAATVQAISQWISGRAS